MAQLTHEQYDIIERAVADGTRLAIGRRGYREYVIVPLAIRQRDGREAIETRNPTTGLDMTIYIDEIASVAAVK